MKLIHTADLHLCSQITASLDTEKTAIRRAEIISAFTGIVDFAKENVVSAILISGDVFDDGERIVRSTLNRFLTVCEENPDIFFYILSGNHDGEDFSKLWPSIPENVKLFPKDQGFTSYNVGEGVCISGAVLGSDDNRALTESLRLSEDDVNIVMLHGQMERSGNVLCKRMLSGKNIDYLALGHIHSYRAEKLDKRGIYCYSGCPAGRGFDECGEKGFSLITVEGGKLTHEFVALGGRVIHSIDLDVTDVSDPVKEAMSLCSEIDKNDIVSINLTGGYDEGNMPDVEYLKVMLSQKFWYSRVVNKMGVRTDVSKYRNVISLKGEFIRSVESLKIDDEQKRRIIACGLAALSGEEPF